LDVARRIVEAVDSGFKKRLYRRLQWRELRELSEAYLLSDEQRTTRETPVIALLVPHIREVTFWGRLAAAIERSANANDRIVLLSQHGNDTAQFIRRLRFFDNLSALAGIIAVPAYGTGLMNSSDDSAVSSLIGTMQDRRVPTVIIDRRVEMTVDVPYVGAANAAVAAAAIDDLVAAGHRRIGALIELSFISVEAERLAGYEQGLLRNGLEYADQLVRRGELITDERQVETDGIRAGLRNARELLSLAPNVRPTAVFCSTPRLARYLLTALKEAGEPTRADDHSHPVAISVVGFEERPVFEAHGMEIRYAHYRVEDVAHNAYKKLIALIDNPNDGVAANDHLVPYDPIISYPNNARPSSRNMWS
ncbi:MAG: substrate-binding domain-containing protein, partial [Chloroflexota bacterium]|nr:substrate-binding domain-containing protein [Chloroflexota bacterium]